MAKVKKTQKAILYGSDEEINFSVKATNMRHKFKKQFEGIIPMLERRYKETESDIVRTNVEIFVGESEISTESETDFTNVEILVTTSERETESERDIGAAFNVAYKFVPTSNVPVVYAVSPSSV